MIIRFNKQSKIDVNSLRGILDKSRKDIEEKNNKISILKKYLKKTKTKNLFILFLTLGIINYKPELIKLTKDEIKNELSQIKANKAEFIHLASPISQTMEKLSSLYSQLLKMKVFYFIDPTYYDYEKIDTKDLNSKYFKFYKDKKQNELVIEQTENNKKINLYSFTSLFIDKAIDKDTSNYEIYSFDNTKVDTKLIYFYSDKKYKGLKLEKETYLYHKDDFSKDESILKNPKFYIYSFRLVKITFNYQNTTKEFTFLGSDLDKMNLFNNLLLEYLELLKQITFDVDGLADNKKYKPNDYYELIKTNSDYVWLILDILKCNNDGDTIDIHKIYKKYSLNYSDLMNIVMIMKKYSFCDLSLGMTLLPKVKAKDIESEYQKLIRENKESLIKGANNG